MKASDGFPTLKVRPIGAPSEAERPRSAATPSRWRGGSRGGCTGSSAVAAYSWITLLLREQKVHHPAATDMRAGTSAVVEQLLLVAPGVLQGVGQDRHFRKVP